MPITLNDETTMLLATLQNQRDHVVGILEGLSDEDLRRGPLPTGWTCLGLVQHLALDVERFWFWNVVAGEPAEDGTAIEDAWLVAPGADPREILERYRVEASRATDVIMTTPLDAAPRWWPQELFGTWRLHNLRHVMLHVIAETACHAGHLDAARELLDGRTWLILNR